MKSKLHIASLAIICLAIIGGCVALTRGHVVALLQPAGTVGLQESRLMILATVLMLLVVVPVLVLTFWIAWKYRAGHADSEYQPDFDHNVAAEAVWWGVPLLIIGVLAAITWTSTHELDPAKALASSNKPLTVEVVALDWKWLFIYPQQDIATVNYVEFPKDTPVDFQITSDAPMNSFSIPQLGSQIYAMPGMDMRLNLMASTVGVYNGRSANISGAGFSEMTFTAHSVSDADFSAWVQTVQRQPNSLQARSYNSLAKPSIANPVTYYSSVQPNLYEAVIDKYDEPSGASTSKMDMQ